MHTYKAVLSPNMKRCLEKWPESANEPDFGLPTRNPISPQDWRLKVKNNRYSTTINFGATLHILDQLI